MRLTAVCTLQSAKRQPANNHLVTSLNISEQRLMLARRYYEPTTHTSHAHVTRTLTFVIWLELHAGTSKRFLRLRQFASRIKRTTRQVTLKTKRRRVMSMLTFCMCVCVCVGVCQLWTVPCNQISYHGSTSVPFAPGSPVRLPPSGVQQVLHLRSRHEVAIPHLAAPRLVGCKFVRPSMHACGGCLHH